MNSPVNNDMPLNTLMLKSVFTKLPPTDSIGHTCSPQVAIKNLHNNENVYVVYRRQFQIILRLGSTGETLLTRPPPSVRNSQTILKTTNSYSTHRISHTRTLTAIGSNGI